MKGRGGATGLDMERVYQAARGGNLAGLLDEFNGLDADGVERKLEGLQEAKWREVASKKREGRARLRWYAGMAGLVVLLLALVFVLVVAVVGVVQQWTEKTKTAQTQQTLITQTAATAVGTAQAETPAAGPTTAPTAGPTPPPAAGPDKTPGVIEAATVLQTDEQIKAANPPFPQQGEAYYLLTYEQAQLTPGRDDPRWKLNNSAKEGPYVYTANPDGTATVKWTMGSTPADGLYEVLVADTKDNSDGPAAYQVDIMKEGVAQADRLRYGVASVQFAKQDSLSPAAWLPLGVYDVKKGEAIQVQSLAGSNNNLAVNKLLIARLRQTDADLLGALWKTANVQGPRYFAIAGLDNLTFEYYDGKNWQSGANGWELKKDMNQAWTQQFWTLPLAAKKTVKVTWTFPNQVPEAKYDIFVLIPQAGITEPAAPYETGDGVLLKTISQKDYPGQWVKVNEQPQDFAGTVSILLHFTDAAPKGDVGVGAMAIVQVP